MRQLLLILPIILFSECTSSQINLKNEKTLDKQPIDTSVKAQSPLRNPLKTDTISICSFNIQFLGHFKARDNNTLSKILKPYDIVVIQEMVAPPVSGTFPSNGQNYKSDVESKAFVDAMQEQGFSYWLSTEDTGPTRNHVNSSASEWWITFYRDAVIVPDSSRYFGFLDTALAGSLLFERVPFCLPFKSIDGKTTFSLISLHLKPGNGVADRTRRAEELKTLFEWGAKQQETNKDYIYLGDCNIYKEGEFIEYEKQAIYSLNKQCSSTNTKLYEDAKKGKPYDHVFYTNSSEDEIIKESFKVVDLMKEVRTLYKGESFPYEPYEHNLFRTKFSDHVPIAFKYILGKDKD
ncbi:hypothetical protein OAN33_02445 [Flavobacteriales bacterium]|nr:hypothetical protein [Flavobacteriales bacterium]